MKNRSRIISYVLIILSVSFIALTGCKDDFFEMKAGDRITPDQFYESIIDADVALDGAIANLQEAMPQLIMLDGLRSDMMDVTVNASPDMIAINNQEFSKENPFTDASNLYKVIINVNEVLANIDSISNRDRLFTDILKMQYKGALITLRSWTYFTLARLYDKVAYIDDNLVELPENLNQNIIEGKQNVIDTLIAQLIPYVYIENEVGYDEEKLRFYMNTKALLGELYLEKGDYANAAVYLKLACESYGNQDEDGLKIDEAFASESWENIFFNAFSQGTENISVIPYSRAENQYNPIPEWLGIDYLYMAKPSNVLINTFNTQIGAEGDMGDLYRGLGVTFDFDTTTNLSYIKKYEIDEQDPFSSDIIVSRAGDINLLLAEAYNRSVDQNGISYALMLMNNGVANTSPKPTTFLQWTENIGIRGRAYLETKEVPNDYTGDIKDLVEDYIIEERALELAFEGKRWFDLVRVAERRNDPSYLADKVAAKFEGTSEYSTVHAFLMNPANWYLPFE